MQIKEMFTGIRVLELASVLAGPSVGQFFAELGAEVVKIENPEFGGDVTRSWKLKDEQTDDISAYFSCVNWGKKSVTLNLKSSEDLSKLYRLVATCDFVIASYKPGDARKLGVDYDSLKKVKDDIIYGEITGYGASNPKVGYDAIIQAEAGFMSINGEANGGPVKMPVALMDILAGHQLKEAMLLAYIKKMKTGLGSHVGVSLIEAAVASLANQGSNWLIAKKEPSRQGSSHPNIAPYGDVFITKDNRQLLLAVGSDQQFSRLCEYLNLDLIINDSRFKSNKERVTHREELKEILQEAISDKSIVDIIPVMDRMKVPVGEVRTISQALALEDVESCLIHAENRVGLRTFVAKERNSENSPHFLPPPNLGEHTQEILTNL